jgi:hypothetical protein
MRIDRTSYRQSGQGGGAVRINPPPIVNRHGNAGIGPDQPGSDATGRAGENTHPSNFNHCGTPVLTVHSYHSAAPRC